MKVTIRRGGLAGAAIWLAAIATSFSSVPVDAQAPSAATFHKDVAPILQKNCQACHRPGQVAPMSLLTYQDARPWARSIRTKVVAREMPPWFADPQYGHFANDRNLSQRDIDTITAWVDGGAKEGDPKDAPAPVQWPADGWTIKPDRVAGGAEFHVPESGVVEYYNMAIPTGFTEDTWITSIEIKPSERAVAHHICMSFQPHTPADQHGVPRLAKQSAPTATPTPATTGPVVNTGSTGGLEHCYLPGNMATDYRPFNAAKLVPAGTDILLQMHYTPTGKAVVDRPVVGFTTTKTPPQRRWVSALVRPSPDTFKIPPHDPNWQAPLVAAMFTEDAELVWMMPHMHLRGKDMSFRLEYPDGKSEIVLSVPKYDFNWQIGYTVARPVKVPKGTKIHAVAHYNNAATNRFNPDPSATVPWGDQTWDEMMSPFFAYLVDVNVDPKKVLQRIEPPITTAQAR